MMPPPITTMRAAVEGEPEPTELSLLNSNFRANRSDVETPARPSVRNRRRESSWLVGPSQARSIGSAMPHLWHRPDDGGACSSQDRRVTSDDVARPDFRH